MKSLLSWITGLQTLEAEIHAFSAMYRTVKYIGRNRS